MNPGRAKSPTIFLNLHKKKRNWFLGIVMIPVMVSIGSNGLKFAVISKKEWRFTKDDAQWKNVIKAKYEVDDLGW